VKVLIGSTLTLTKVVILAAAVVITLSLARQPSAESATDTQIMFSYSSLSPIGAPAIILTPNGFPRDIYVWATNVKEPTGVSGFNIAVQYDDSLFAASAAPGDADGIGDRAWLQSTNRSGACIPGQNPQAGQVIGLCSTLSPPPPLGPTGTGLIGHLVLTPGSEMALSSPLAFVAPDVGVQGTFLLDAPVDLDLEQIPLTLKNSNIVYLGCADNSPPPNGDGVVDLANDILGVIIRFQMTPLDPDWSPAFDINSDGFIDLANDILGTILQFQLPCNQP